MRDAAKPRPGINPALFTTSAIDVLDDGCDIIVELVGGVHAAGAFVRRALRTGHHVVTANKALLADSGRELFAAARTHGVRIGFEASVCGGIPIVGALRRGLAGDRIESISGILNGTCNYILTRMEQDDLEFDGRAARWRRSAGSRRPIRRSTSAATMPRRSCASSSELAFGPMTMRLRVHGIADVTRAEIEQARGRRCVVRHVAAARRVAGGIEMRVERRELPESHPLAAVRDENNAVVIRGRAVGEMMFQGKGAGSLPTAAAVLSDVIEPRSAEPYA